LFVVVVQIDLGQFLVAASFDVLDDELALDEMPLRLVKEQTDVAVAFFGDADADSRLIANFDVPDQRQLVILVLFERKQIDHRVGVHLLLLLGQLVGGNLLHVVVDFLPAFVARDDDDDLQIEVHDLHVHAEAESLVMGSDLQVVIDRLAEAIEFARAFANLGGKLGQLLLAALGRDGLVDNGPQVLVLTGAAEVSRDQQRRQSARRQYKSFHGTFSRRGKLASVLSGANRRRNTPRTESFFGPAYQSRPSPSMARRSQARANAQCR